MSVKEKPKLKEYLEGKHRELSISFLDNPNDESVKAQLKIIVDIIIICQERNKF